MYRKKAQIAWPMLDLPDVSPVSGAPDAAIAASNDLVTQDILNVVDKLSDRFESGFKTVTDPETYIRINDSLQQIDPAALARLGAMLGGGTVGLRRALAGDTPMEVLRGTATGAALGAIGGYFLPRLLDAVVQSKQAQFRIDNSLIEGMEKAGDMTKTAIGLAWAVALMIAGFAIGGILAGGAYKYKYDSDLAKAEKARIEAEQRSKALQAQVEQLKRTTTPLLSHADIKPAIGGFGMGSLLGYLYAKLRNKNKDEEEKINPIVPTLIGGGLGSLAGIAARHMLAGPQNTAAVQPAQVPTTTQV